MELYRWVKALQRFAHNIRTAVAPIVQIVDATEMLFVRIVIFGGFLYGIYELARR